MTAEPKWGKPANIQIHIDSPAPRNAHVHRWAWCQRVDGAEILRCYDCGRLA